MPQRRKLNSLRSICMWEIMKNLGLYTSEELQNLTTDLSEELIQLYNQEFLQREKKKKSVEHYLLCTYRNRLFKRNMKKLDLLCPVGCQPFFNETLTMTLEICKNLTHFSCNFQGQSHLNLHQLVISIPNINELKLHIGNPEEKYKDLEYDDDDIFEAIGNNCFQLEILHLTNSRITTQGVRRFCRSNSAGARIEELNLEKSRVKITGCLTALRNLKHLTRFNCGGLVLEGFRKLYQDSYQSPVPSFQLCELPVMYTNYIPTGFLSFVMACCPNIRTLHLHTRVNFNQHLLNDLKSWHENGSLYLHIVHVDNFMSDLIYVGSRVTKLTFRKCGVHLPTIGFNCPNLTDLCLRGVKYTHVNYEARNNFVVAFSKLLKLHLRSKGSLPIPIELLQFLLENCFDLQTLKIDYNDEFIDDVMSRILQGVNPLRHLTHFELECCNVVSSVAILQLLQADNELTRLTIHGCEKIKKNEFLQIESAIKENNFDVTFEKDESDDKNEEPDEESNDESDEESNDDESDHDL